MHEHKLPRRAALARAGLAVGAALAGSATAPSLLAASANRRRHRPFLFCLNTATIRGQKLGIVKEIEIAAQAGYDALEPWVSAIEEYVKSGGKLAELKRRLADAGLTLESAITFPEWLVDDDARRRKGLERAKHDMDLVAQLGGTRLAAPPAGATDLRDLELARAAERYRALLEAGDQIGVVPQLELWSFSKCVGRLGQGVAVAIETGHPRACVLPDVFHLYKSGSDHRGMALLGAAAIHVLHLNDYPAEPPPERLDDSFRVFPGDGCAPLTDILRTLRGTGGQKVLSLELFNRQYWAQDPLLVAKTGLTRMKQVATQLPDATVKSPR